MKPSIKRNKKLLPLLLAALIALPVILNIFLDEEKMTINAPGLDHTLIIDPGHGGVDSGALAVNGLKESDINLFIALRLRALAEFCGQTNVITRESDVTLSDTLRYSEHRDLERRAEIVNEAANPIYFAIHQNCYPTGQPSGTVVIYSQNGKSENLGKLVHQNLINKLNCNNRRLAEPDTNKLYVLSNVQCPAILIECGFMSNFSELEKLNSPGYQKLLALVMMGSFVQYVENTKFI